MLRSRIVSAYNRPSWIHRRCIHQSESLYGLLPRRRSTTSSIRSDSKNMLHSIWKSAASCSIGSSLIGSSSPRSSAKLWSPVVSQTRPSRPFQHHRWSKTCTIDMLKGRSSCGTKSKRSSRRTVISYSLMSASSRPEATRRKVGQIRGPMSPSKIVQVNSLVRPSALLSANATDYST
jgi:hypothetical protein